MYVAVVLQLLGIEFVPCGHCIHASLGTVVLFSLPSLRLLLLLSSCSGLFGTACYCPTYTCSSSGSSDEPVIRVQMINFGAPSKFPPLFFLLVVC